MFRADSGVNCGSLWLGRDLTDAEYNQVRPSSSSNGRKGSLLPRGQLLYEGAPREQVTDDVIVMLQSLADKGFLTNE